MARIWSANQAPGRVIYAMTEPATAITNTTAEGLLVPNVTIPANFLRTGSVLRATLGGVVSNVVTTPGTLQFRVRWGGLTGTSLVASATLAQTAVATTDAAWWWENYLTCTADGTEGTIICIGQSQRNNKAVAVAGDAVPDLIPPNDSAGFFSAPSPVDLTTESVLSFTAKFSVNTATTSITCYHYILEAVN